MPVSPAQNWHSHCSHYDSSAVRSGLSKPHKKRYSRVRGILWSLQGPVGLRSKAWGWLTASVERWPLVLRRSTTEVLLISPVENVSCLGIRGAAYFVIWFHPCARHRSNKKAATCSASLTYLTMRVPAHWVAHLIVFSITIWVCLCHQANLTWSLQSLGLLQWPSVGQASESQGKVLEEGQGCLRELAISWGTQRYS